MKQQVEGTARVPILVATTRKKAAEDPGEMFGGERAEPAGQGQRGQSQQQEEWDNQPDRDSPHPGSPPDGNGLARLGFARLSRVSCYAP